jgi:anti-sigma factor RsiW
MNMTDTKVWPQNTTKRMMTHREIENEEIIERYVRARLGAEERRSFQEHFLACDECFANVQMAERFIGGVTYAAEHGLLDDRVSGHATAFSAVWDRWMKPVFVLMAATCITLAVVVGWLLLVHLPRLRSEIARSRQAQEQLAEQKQREIVDLNTRLKRAEQSSARPEQDVSNHETVERTEQQAEKSAGANRRPADRVSPELLAANVPVVVLQGTRDPQETNELKLPPRSQKFRLWIEVGPRTQFRSFRIEILTPESRLVKTVGGLQRNSRNAIPATLPTQAFPTGGYLVRLYGVDQAQATLVGEYKLQIERK